MIHKGNKRTLSKIVNSDGCEHQEKIVSKMDKRTLEFLFRMLKSVVSGKSNIFIIIVLKCI